MTRKTTKTKDKVFSSNQFAMSEVPINEFVQTKTNAAIKLSNQIFFLNGILLFEIAIVKLIKSISFGMSNWEWLPTEKIPRSEIYRIRGVKNACNDQTNLFIFQKLIFLRITKPNF